MTNIVQLTNRTVTVERLVEVSGEKSYTQTVVVGLNVNIQKLDEMVSVYGNSEYVMFTNYDIIVGDRITDNKGVSYKVKGVRKYTSIIGNHKEIFLSTKYD